MTFRVGQKVVVVREYPHNKFPDCKPPRLGRVYTIRTIREGRTGEGLEFHLYEIRNAKRSTDTEYGEPTYHHSRFRPVVDGGTDISVFKEALTPSGAKIREDA